jgi:hypothetical protein
MFGLNWYQIFGLTGFGALVGLLGTIIGHFLKEVVFARGFEKWNANRAAKASLSLLVGPMFQAAADLLTRLQEIYNDFPPEYLDLNALNAPSPNLHTNDTSDPHYQHYKLVSTLYRFSAFWGWVEVFRREVVSVRSYQSNRLSVIESWIEELRSDLADGQHNTHEDWHAWRDRLVFREELRAIGEWMIAAPPSQGIIGYASFCNFVAQHPDAEWLAVTANFFVNLQTTQDFRKARLLRLIVHLHELLEALDEERIPEKLSKEKLNYTLPVARRS